MYRCVARDYRPEVQAGRLAGWAGWTGWLAGRGWSSRVRCSGRVSGYQMTAVPLCSATCANLVLLLLVDLLVTPWWRIPLLG